MAKVQAYGLESQAGSDARPRLRQAPPPVPMPRPWLGGVSHPGGLWLSGHPQDFDKSMTVELYFLTVVLYFMLA